MAKSAAGVEDETAVFPTTDIGGTGSGFDPPDGCAGFTGMAPGVTPGPRAWGGLTEAADAGAGAGLSPLNGAGRVGVAAPGAGAEGGRCPGPGAEGGVGTGGVAGAGFGARWPGGTGGAGFGAGAAETGAERSGVPD